MPIFDHLKPKSKFLSPDEVIESLDINPEEVIIDFGSGPGFWTIPMAQKVGIKGLVVAIDQYEENLKIIKSKADRLGLDNIKYVHAPYGSDRIPTNEKADLILISNILSLVDTDNELINSAKNNAKNDSKLVIIDWDEKTPMISEKEQVKKEEVITAAERIGFPDDHEEYRRDIRMARETFEIK